MKKQINSGSMFTITRTTKNGVLEFLTKEGFRSEEAIFFKNLEKLTFSQEEGAKVVKELRKSCRLPDMKKSIILNY